MLFLADAGGIPVIAAASLHAHGAPKRLFMQRELPCVGLSDTSTASQIVSDSAASMTAIVTGQRTHNGVIAQSAAAVRGKRDGEALKTILEYAEERGLSTGVITNDSLTGATPPRARHRSHGADGQGHREDGLAGGQGHAADADSRSLVRPAAARRPARRAAAGRSRRGDGEGQAEKNPTLRTSSLRMENSHTGEPVIVAAKGRARSGCAGSC